MLWGLRWTDVSSDIVENRTKFFQNTISLSELSTVL